MQESNFTTFGSSKELLLLNKLQDGWLGADNQEKMIYIPLLHFREKGLTNGW